MKTCVVLSSKGPPKWDSMLNNSRLYSLEFLGFEVSVLFLRYLMFYLSFSLPAVGRTLS